MTKHQINFDRFYQRFLNSYLLRRPVDASFIGRHEFDDMLPDFTPEGVRETKDELQLLLDESRRFALDGLLCRQLLDKRMIEGYLEQTLWEFSSFHFHQGNPSMYVGEAVFGMLVCVLTKYAPACVRLESMAARMEKMPMYFAQAKKNIDSSPAIWTKRAIQECEGGLAFLRHGLGRILKEENYFSSRLQKASYTAQVALSDYKHYLQNELLQKPRDSVAAGRESFRMIVEKVHCADINLDEYLRYAQSEVERTTKYLEAHAKDFGAATPQEALAGLADFHPDAENYMSKFQEIWDAVENLAKENDLVTWPDFPIEYMNRYEWAKECAPYLYFIFYRPPAFFNRPVVMDYLAPPLWPDFTPEQQKAFLRANNNEVIKNNHVVHHGSLGHHVQSWNAYHQDKSYIGQFAACDGASRLVMLSSGTMAEGWAVYATMLTSEYGFNTPLEDYAAVQARRRTAARSVVDIKLHCGDFTLEQAIDYYRTHVGMDEEACVSEAVKNSMFPGGAIMYLYGSDLIYNFREAVRIHKGAEFSVGRFHDDFLSFGSIPAALVKAELEREYGMNN